MDEVANAMAGLSFPTPSGTLSFREDHNAIEDVLVGITKMTPQYLFPILDPKRLEVFPAKDVIAPVGTKTVDWIKVGKCNKRQGQSE